jgi:hypothetical protein
MSRVLSLKTITPACSKLPKNPSANSVKKWAVGIAFIGPHHESRLALSVIRPRSLAKLAASRIVVTSRLRKNGQHQLDLPPVARFIDWRRALAASAGNQRFLFEPGAEQPGPVLRRMNRQISHTNQVVGGCCEREDPPYPEDSTVPDLPQQRDGF